MVVSYKPLFKLLIDKKMKKKDFAKLTGLSNSTVSKLAKDENVTMEVIDKICRNLNCKIEDIVTITTEWLLNLRGIYDN